jgi:hypothetical protein
MQTFISVSGSRTAGHRQVFIWKTIPVNEEIVPDKDTVAFVSVASEGILVEQTVRLAQKVIAAGGTVVMDRSGTGFGQSHSKFNRNGEGRVQDALGTPAGQTKEGYNVFGNIGSVKG